MSKGLTFRLFLPEDAKAVKAFVAGNPLATELKNYLVLNGNTPVEGAIWLGENNKKSLCRVIFDNGSITAYFSEKNVAFYKNQTDACAWQKPNEKNRLFAMVLKNPKAPIAQPLHALESTAQLLQIYKLMEGSDVLSDAAQKAYIHRCRTVQHGYAHVFAEVQSNQLAGVAQIVAKDEKYALIGDVFTDKLYRGQGIATRLLGACVAFSLYNRLTPFLLCQKELITFYQKRGFKNYYGKL